MLPHGSHRLPSVVLVGPLPVKGKNLLTNRIVGLYTETGFEILREM